MAYLSAGYYVTRLTERAAHMSPELVPDKLLSASRCICDFFPNDWAITWASVTDEERLKRAAAFGLSSTDLPAVIGWATESFSRTFGWPDSFYKLEAARDARAKLLPADRDTVIVGLGLHEADAEEFLLAAKPPVQEPGLSPVGNSGIFECVSARTNIADGGEFLGFELLATYFGQLTCSWLCNGLETECARRLGIVTNGHGFVQTYADASRCAELISKDEIGAEPGLWLPWHVSIYPKP
jgi:hypothetical protein